MTDHDADAIEAMARERARHEIVTRTPPGVPDCTCGWSVDRTADAWSYAAHSEHVEGAVLDALLAVEGTCQTCGGTGKHPKDDRPFTRYGAWECPTCGGSGSDGTPALVGMLMEQVGWAGRDSLETAGAWGYWITDAKRERIEAKPVYRVRPDTEGEK